MDYIKIGKFIKELREKNNMSQEALSQKLLCDRTKVNKIENGKRYIKLEELILLSEIFGLSLEELISGERLDNKNKKKIEITFKEYLKIQNTKLKKMHLTIIILFIFLVIVLFMLTIIYFFQNYNSIRIYKFYGTSENYEINDGILILSKEKIYLEVNRIIPEIDDIEIYSEQDNKKSLIYEGNPNNILNDYYGYNSLISYEDFINKKQKIFIIINGEKIDLTFKEDFINNNFYYKKKKTGEKNKENKENESIIPKKIEENFQCEKSTCSLILDKEKIIYNSGIFSVMNEKEYYNYDIDNQILFYQNLENENNDFILAISNNKIICTSGKCNKDIYDRFYNSYLLKYLK